MSSSWRKFAPWRWSPPDACGSLNRWRRDGVLSTLILPSETPLNQNGKETQMADDSPIKKIVFTDEMTHDFFQSIYKSSVRLVKTVLAGFLVAALIAIVVGLIYFMKFHGSLSSQHEQWGQFGDYVGGILNPLFSFAAMIGVFVTVVLQLQSLRLTMKELTDASVANAEQSKSAARQNFETTFFQMLSLHNEIINAMEIAQHQRPTITGRVCFAALLSRLKEQVPGDSADAANWMTAYDAFSANYQNQLGHYFRLLYNIIKFVDRSDGEFEQKKFYSNLVRAQLSDSELRLLFYNCLSKWGIDKFKPLVEKFALLKTLDTRGIPPALIHDYSADAFSGEYPV
jgi:hypothetical protein